MKVLNKRTDNIPPDAVYVGRPTKWGNPFALGELAMPAATSKRERHQAVVDQYHLWIQAQPHLMAALQELSCKDLVCWCAPLPCHANVLMELANQ